MCLVLMPISPDYETDKSIQASLRAALARDVTVLTVAHRLQTIMDSDRIVSTRSVSYIPLTRGLVLALSMPLFSHFSRDSPHLHCMCAAWTTQWFAGLR